MTDPPIFDRQRIDESAAVLYARVSSKEQEREGYSIPAQLQLLHDYAKTKRLKIVREFIDVETAKVAGRNQFGKMVEFLHNQKGLQKGVQQILVEKTDRLYRNFKDYVILEDLGVLIHLVNENDILGKDSRSHAKLIHGLKVLLAKNFLDNLSEEVKKGHLEKVSKVDIQLKPP